MFTLNDPKYREAREKAKELLSKMTLEEKVIQLTQYIGTDNSYNPEHKEKDGSTNAGRCGSLLAVCGAATVNGFQKIALEYTPHSVPVITGCDVIHGYRTTMPIPLALSCTFEPDLIRKCYGIIGKEAASDGVHWVYAPMVDVARDSRWGRVAEGYGEDTYLCSEMASAAVHGFQDDGGVMACMKHFVAYSAGEGGRDYNGCEMSMQTLFNTFIPPFQAGVDAGVGTFMNAFNEINGVPCAANRTLLTDILRGKMGFDGFVVSDYDAVMELINHGFAEDEKDAAMKGYNAGVDVLMLGNLYNNYLPELVREGRVSEEQIDESVLRVLAAKYRLGVFDSPFVPDDSDGEFFSDEHLKTARECARRSFVLLENDGTLPLIPEKYKGKKIGVVGPYADDRISVLGCWASIMTPSRTVSILSALKERYSDSDIIFSEGVDFSDGIENIEKACCDMAECDVIIAALGEHSSQSGEATSKTNLELPENQKLLLERLASLGKPIVLLVSAGRPLILDKIRKSVSAILYIWAPGTEAGHAVCDVVSGDFSPSGKTTISFPYTSASLPYYYNHKSTGRPASGEMTFESKYIDTPIGALYPFGYGMSYTTFEYSDAAISSDKIKAESGESINVTLKVKNTGGFEGYDVVQLYVRDVVGSITRPVKELKKFVKVHAAPGEEKEVSMTLSRDDLAFWNADMEYTAEKGRFKLWVAHDSDDNNIEFDFELV